MLDGLNAFFIDETDWNDFDFNYQPRGYLRKLWDYFGEANNWNMDERIEESKNKRNQWCFDKDDTF